MNGRFEGIIQKVNKPKFINKHNVWSISLKENGKWTSVWRKDQSKADELYRLLVKRMKSNGLGIDLKPTTLSQKQLEISQLCFNRLEANEFLKMDDDSTATKMLSAVDFFIQHYYEHEVPKVKDAVQMFLEKQEQRNLSEYTLRDYRNVLSLFVDEYAEARISMVKPMDCKKFVQEKVSPNNRKHRQIYLKAFFEFCCGKNRNILRHTAITYHTLKFRDPMRTAYVAGNSVEMIQRHYLNMNVPKDDIKRFFELTPTKAKEIGIID